MKTLEAIISSSSKMILVDLRNNLNNEGLKNQLCKQVYNIFMYIYDPLLWAKI